MTKIAARAKRLKLGSGTDESAQMGPLHTEKQRDEIESQLADAVARGGRVVAGGQRPAGAEFETGYYFEPTVVVDVPEGARVWTEETFGPLLPIMRVRDLDEAIARANSSEYGLGSSIFTRDMARAQRAIDELEAGLHVGQRRADRPRRAALRRHEAQRLRQRARHRGARLLHGAKVRGHGHLIRCVSGHTVVCAKSVSSADATACLECQDYATRDTRPETAREDCDAC